MNSDAMWSMPGGEQGNLEKLINKVLTEEARFELKTELQEGVSHWKMWWKLEPVGRSSTCKALRCLSFCVSAEQEGRHKADNKKVGRGRQWGQRGNTAGLPLSKAESATSDHDSEIFYNFMILTRGDGGLEEEQVWGCYEWAELVFAFADPSWYRYQSNLLYRQNSHLSHNQDWQ